MVELLSCFFKYNYESIYFRLEVGDILMSVWKLSEACFQLINSIQKLPWGSFNDSPPYIYLYGWCTEDKSCQLEDFLTFTKYLNVDR